MLFNSAAFCVEYRAFPKKNSVLNISEYEKTPMIIKTNKGSSTDYRASNDFITGISFHYEIDFKDKDTLLSHLKSMLPNTENTAMQTRV